MSNCFACGGGFKGTIKDLLNYYKSNKIDVYFYKLHDKGDILLINSKQFKQVFKTQIKPNFINGSEYAHISEYTGK